jgi:hypothetical protein
LLAILAILIISSVLLPPPISHRLRYATTKSTFRLGQVGLGLTLCCSWEFSFAKIMSHFVRHKGDAVISIGTMIWIRKKEFLFFEGHQCWKSIDKQHTSRTEILLVDSSSLNPLATLLTYCDIAIENSIVRS